MDSIRNLIREAHRRSLWQVTGIFLAASWGALQVIETITETAGLPDWTPSMALVLLIIGLPICLATAFVQEGMPGQKDGTGDDETSDDPQAPDLAAATGSLDRPTTRPPGTRRLLTWKHAILGGIGAFALLGFSLVAYFVMWSTGVGPIGNLVAQGVISDRSGSSSHTSRMRPVRTWGRSSRRHCASTSSRLKYSTLLTRPSSHRRWRGCRSPQGRP